MRLSFAIRGNNERCCTHTAAALPATAPQLRQTLPAVPEHTGQRAPSPGLVCSFKTTMFLQNVEFKPWEIDVSCYSKLFIDEEMNSCTQRSCIPKHHIPILLHRKLQKRLTVVTFLMPPFKMFCLNKAVKTQGTNK